MRHRKKFNHLGRKSAHRNAMLANMATSLILHKRIRTTVAKAKALRVYVEPLITRSKDDSTHSRRMVFRYLQSKEAVTELFREISTKVAERPGGYTRILKLGTRLGDSAEMALIELVDYNPNLLNKEAAKTKTTRRSRRGTGKKKTETEAKTPEPKAKKEAPAVEEAPPPVEEVKEEPTVDKVPEVKEEVKEEPAVDKTPEVAEEAKEEPAVDEVPETTEEVKEEPTAQADTPPPADEKTEEGDDTKKEA
jgi:large subunit ribosomal protein L17